VRDQQHAENDHVDFRRACPQQFGHQHKQDGAQQRAGYFIAAAQDGDGDDGERRGRAEGLQRLEIGGAQDHQPADHAGDDGRKNEGQELQCRRVDTDRFGGDFVFANGEKPGTEPAGADEVERDHADDRERQHRFEQNTQARRADQQAAVAAETGLGADHDVFDEFGDAEREDHKIGAAHAQARPAQGGRQQRRRHAAYRDGKPQRQHHPQQHGHISAGTVESGMAERNVAGKPREQRPAFGKGNPHQHIERNAERVRSGHERQRRAGRDREHADQPDMPLPDHRALIDRPSRPCGRNSSTAMNTP
jgi:hypothetical protein